MWKVPSISGYVEEVQAMQWPNEKGQNDKQWSTKNYTEN